jgi:hypothetical protein
LEVTIRDVHLIMASDIWSWRSDAGGLFLVHSPYPILAIDFVGVEVLPLWKATVFKQFWLSSTPPKVLYFFLETSSQSSSI